VLKIGKRNRAQARLARAQAESQELANKAARHELDKQIRDEREQAAAALPWWRQPTLGAAIRVLQSGRPPVR